MGSEFAQHRGRCKVRWTGTHGHRRRGRSTLVKREKQRIREFRSVSSRLSLITLIIEETSPTLLTDSEHPVQKTVNGVQVLDDSKSRVLFGPNYSRLQRLKAQYDPECVFSKWFPITPNADA